MKQLLNSVTEKYCGLSVSRRSIIYLGIWLWQIIELLATDKSQHVAQPRLITGKNVCLQGTVYLILSSYGPSRRS